MKHKVKAKVPAVTYGKQIPKQLKKQSKYDLVTLFKNFKVGGCVTVSHLEADRIYLAGYERGIRLIRRRTKSGKFKMFRVRKNARIPNE